MRLLLQAVYLAALVAVLFDGRVLRSGTPARFTLQQQQQQQEQQHQQQHKQQNMSSKPPATAWHALHSHGADSSDDSTTAHSQNTACNAHLSMHSASCPCLTAARTQSQLG
jgi:transcription initiation factor TFIID subunit TAF12